jgi:hypothetical protein
MNTHLLFLLSILSTNVLSADEIPGTSRLPIGDFCQYQTEASFSQHWQPLKFPGIDRQTAYQRLTIHEDNNQYCTVYAKANASASGLIYRQEIDLAKTPILEWSWKISHSIPGGDAKEKAGDDFAARIYVAFQAQPEQLSWYEKIKYKAAEILYDLQPPGTAINYIWANKLAPDTAIVNPYTDKTMMIAVRSGDAEAGEWHTERRNIVEDYRRAFGKNPPEVMGIAMMTDTDNTGASAEAWYRQIILKSDD